MFEIMLVVGVVLVLGVILAYIALRNRHPSPGRITIDHSTFTQAELDSLRRARERRDRFGALPPSGREHEVGKTVEQIRRERAAREATKSETPATPQSTSQQGELWSAPLDVSYPASSAPDPTPAPAPTPHAFGGGGDFGGGGASDSWGSSHSSHSSYDSGGGGSSSYDSGSSSSSDSGGGGGGGGGE